MRIYFDKNELLEAKADEKLITYFIVYKSWDEKTFKNIPEEGLIININPTSYSTINMAKKYKNKFMHIGRLDKIEIYQTPENLKITIKEFHDMNNYNRKQILFKCNQPVYTEDLRENKNEDYERGFRAGRRNTLRI